MDYLQGKRVPNLTFRRRRNATKIGFLPVSDFFIIKENIPSHKHTFLKLVCHQQTKNHFKSQLELQELGTPMGIGFLLWSLNGRKIQLYPRNLPLTGIRPCLLPLPILGFCPFNFALGCLFRPKILPPGSGLHLDRIHFPSSRLSCSSTTIIPASTIRTRRG